MHTKLNMEGIVEYKKNNELFLEEREILKVTLNQSSSGTELGSVHKNRKLRNSQAENQFPNFKSVHCVRISRAKLRKVWNSAQTRPHLTINKRTYKLCLHVSNVHRDSVHKGVEE